MSRQIFSYLFCFNPEPDSNMADHPKTPVERWRRIQLAKFLLKEEGIDPAAFDYDEAGAPARSHVTTRWRPTGPDAEAIAAQLDLADFLRPGPGPTRPPELRAWPAAGRVG